MKRNPNGIPAGSEVSVPDLPDVMTVEEVAQRCRVCTKTVQRWIAAGYIRAARLMGPTAPYRITREEYLRARELHGIP